MIAVLPLGAGIMSQVPLALLGLLWGFLFAWSWGLLFFFFFHYRGMPRGSCPCFVNLPKEKKILLMDHKKEEEEGYTMSVA